MKLLKSILFENIDIFKYFLPEKSIKDYQKNKILCAILAFFLSSACIIIKSNYDIWFCIPIAILVAYKAPYVYYSMIHKQNITNVVSAIPLWVNQIYALIEQYTIHNAIVNSLDEDTPCAIANDLEMFINQIEETPNNKNAYLNFLSRYDVDGFTDIMLKLYEFRSLSKEKIKYEIKNLNTYLGKIEEEKRKNRFKNEISYIDSIACLIVFVPCIYMTLISLLPSLFTV